MHAMNALLYKVIVTLEMQELRYVHQKLLQALGGYGDCACVGQGVHQNSVLALQLLVK